MLCHIILAMPLLALGLFVFLPFQTALPIYLVVVLSSAIIYHKIMESMKLPVKTGWEEMIGSVVKVVEEINPEGKIWYKNEVWSAVSQENLARGEKAKILGFEGMKTIVQGVHEMDEN